VIRLRLALELDYEIAEPGCDFVFNIHAAHTEQQRVVEEELTLGQDVPSRRRTPPAPPHRMLRL
jgi:hypothetical protein